MIAEPPLLDGAPQERLICVGDADVADRLVTDPGTLEGEDDVGVDEASFDAMLVPTLLIAETR